MNIHIQIHTYKAHIRAKLAEIQTFLGDCFLPRLSHAARRDLSSHVSVRPWQKKCRWPNRPLLPSPLCRGATIYR